MNYKVISNRTQIVELNSALRSSITKTLRHTEIRDISYPAGVDKGCTVHFERSEGKDIAAWTAGTSSMVKEACLNFIMFGEPKSTDSLRIFGQINFSSAKSTTRCAGVFVEDARGAFYIAHRGRLTRGHSSLKMQDVLTEFRKRNPQDFDIISALDAKGRKSELILISALSDENICGRLCAFAKASRDVAELLSKSSSGKSVINKDDSGTTGTANFQRSKLLKEYFDEFSGAAEKRGQAPTSISMEHGAIVRDLATWLRPQGEIRKSQAIDLALLKDSEVHLFEIKTSACSTDIYTATGQLFIHGNNISSLIEMPVRHYLVLPQQPAPAYLEALITSGFARIVTYEKQGNLYKFMGYESI